jgi:hypothetical protein
VRGTAVNGYGGTGCKPAQAERFHLLSIWEIELFIWEIELFIWEIEFPI